MDPLYLHYSVANNITQMPLFWFSCCRFTHMNTKTVLEFLKVTNDLYRESTWSAWIRIMANVFTSVESSMLDKVTGELHSTIGNSSGAHFKPTPTTISSVGFSRLATTPLDYNSSLGNTTNQGEFPAYICLHIWISFYLLYYNLKICNGKAGSTLLTWNSNSDSLSTQVVVPLCDCYVSKK